MSCKLISVSVGAIVSFSMISNLVAGDLQIKWAQLPPLPDPVGVAGAYAGVSHGILYVAGGANFPDKMPWEGGRKIWHDSAFCLDRPDGTWKPAGKLPRPRAYGVSVTIPDGILCIGGSDETAHVRDVFLVSFELRRWVTWPMPSLPAPLANSCGALVGKTVYVAGGTRTPDATSAQNTFLALDISTTNSTWRELPPWPGPGRMLATAAAIGNDFYIAGGTALAPDAEGKPSRTYLKDAYRFRPGEGWTRIADMPNPVVAAPTPAPVVDGKKFLVVGGDDGSLANFAPREKHPGFPKRTLCYNVRTGTWTEEGKDGPSRATLPTAEWKGRSILVSGEARPGVRSPEVWAATFEP